MRRRMQTAPSAANKANPPAKLLPRAVSGENAQLAAAWPCAWQLEPVQLELPLAVTVMFNLSFKAWMQASTLPL